MAYEISFLRLLRDISEAARLRERSESDYWRLLRKIFKKEGLHDFTSRWEAHSGLLKKHFKKERRHDSALSSSLRADDLEHESFRKGGRHDSALSSSLMADDLVHKSFRKGGPHADPEVDYVEHLRILESEDDSSRYQQKRKLFLKCCYPDDKGIQLSAIPILGATGIGKTEFARHLYANERVVEHFEMRIWVKVDGMELSLHHAAQQILESAMHMRCSIDDLNELDEMVRDALIGRRCLIVFDGVESMTEDVWLHMNNYWFSSVDLGSIVLITTPSEGVANLVSSEAIQLKPMSQYDIRTRYPYFVDGSLSINVEALCGGIPLLLNLVRSMIQFDDKIKNLLCNVTFSDAPYLSDFDASVAILLSIWALPLHLRQCLALCSIFPKGYALNREKIINQCSTLVQPSRTDNQLDIGYYYIHELRIRYFFTDIVTIEYDEVTDFQMPGMIHTIMQDVASIVWKGKVGAIGSISEDAHQLSLHSEYARKHMPKDVRSLILSSNLYSGATTLDYTFLDFQELESLDLSCSGIRNLSHYIYALRKLKCLNLSYTLIEGLPDSITGLPRLQALDLSRCYHFKVLPKKLCNLRYMTHLDLSQCESLSYFPSGIGSLESLTSLPLFVLGKDHDCAHLGELSLLNQLRGRLEIRNLENVMEISEARDAKLYMKELHHLGLSWSKAVGNCFEVLELLYQHCLKFLDLTGFMGLRFPGWISSIHSLTKITITNCGCEELPSLGQLPYLKELQLKEMTNIQYIGPEFYGDRVDAFPYLEQLGLYDMPILFKWSGAGATVSGEVCRRLKTLTIEGCPQLYDIPTFGNLLDLIVCNCSDKILSFRKQTGFGSLSSLLMKNMELGMFLGDSTGWRSLKKLIFFNCTWYTDTAYFEMLEFTELKHLGIAQCPQVRVMKLRSKYSIQELHVVDCPNLERIFFNSEANKLTKLVIDGCPELCWPNSISNLGSVTKLMIRGSDKFIGPRDFKELRKLQYLCISECPGLEKELEMEPSLISHIPCVILGNRKVTRIPKIPERSGDEASQKEVESSI